MKLLIIVPAYNEEKTIGRVLDQLKNLKIKDIQQEIIVINDGSQDGTISQALKRNVTVLTHIINRGLGGALGTGLEYARKAKADIVVTFDADGQHNFRDLNKIIEPVIKKQADVVIGSRMLKSRGMPMDRKIINYLANLINYILWSVWVTDTQSGLRAFSKKSLDEI